MPIYRQQPKQAMVAKDAVVLLHGLSRSRWSLWRLQRSLRSEYNVINQSYPSRQNSVEELAKLAIEPALALCADAPRIHFVTHSLGGILVRQYLSENTIQNLGKVVMLGPPNQGSELVDTFRSTPLLRSLFDRINGPAGAQLGTGSNSKPQQLGAANFSCGVIAGNRNLNVIYRFLMPKNSDGKVSVASTHIEGLSDHVELPVDHTFMMNDSRVIKATHHFLKHGHF